MTFASGTQFSSQSDIGRPCIYCQCCPQHPCTFCYLFRALQVTARRRINADKPPGSMDAAALPIMTNSGSFESNTRAAQAYGSVGAVARKPAATLSPGTGSSHASHATYTVLVSPAGGQSADAALRTLVLNSSCLPVMVLQGGVYSFQSSASSLPVGTSVVIEAAAGQHVVRSDICIVAARCMTFCVLRF